MNKEYCYKLKLLVNNHNGTDTINKIENLKHSINKEDYISNAKQLYSDNAQLFESIAEENIVTITDYNDYINWVGND
ncbi:MAG: hypothetical protein SPF07_05090 [Eubacteriales bacterium]|nr:hypothetical protein [Eubacteriales bacterium]